MEYTFILVICIVVLFILVFLIVDKISNFNEIFEFVVLVITALITIGLFFIPVKHKTDKIIIANNPKEVYFDSDEKELQYYKNTSEGVISQKIDYKIKPKINELYVLDKEAQPYMKITMDYNVLGHPFYIKEINFYLPKGE